MIAAGAKNPRSHADPPISTSEDTYPTASEVNIPQTGSHKANKDYRQRCANDRTHETGEEKGELVPFMYFSALGEPFFDSHRRLIL